MSDLQKYTQNRIAKDVEFAEDFDEGYANFGMVQNKIDHLYNYRGIGRP